MTATGDTEDPSPSWDDVRDEASALTREVAHQSLQWTRRAFRLAGSMADVAFAASKKAAERAQQAADRVRNR